MQEVSFLVEISRKSSLRSLMEKERKGSTETMSLVMNGKHMILSNCTYRFVNNTLQKSPVMIGYEIRTGKFNGFQGPVIKVALHYWFLAKLYGILHKSRMIEKFRFSD